ncbi:MAG TPA: hypothetical protein ENN36_07225 [Candidatus Bathyarchaeota archaeon]|nr:hypothetical protein [Candidatus Bathyarchaeota archaeon]
MKLTSPKAYEVVKYLLEHKETSQWEISRETGVAYGWTNEVVNFLYDRGIVSKGWRRCELEETLQLLEVIALERPLNMLVRSSFNLEVLSVVEGEELLRRVCREQGVSYGLTVFSGLRRYYEYYITFPEVHAYVSDKEVASKIGQGRGPITLSLLSPDQASILEETEEHEGFSVCSPVQVVVDLFCSGAGRDAAIKLLEVIRNGKV